MYWNRLLASVCTAICISTLTVHAANVTISFVTPAANGVQPVDELQTLWISPFGGWCGSLWPFGLSVDDKPIMRVLSEQEKQSALSMAAAESHTADSALINQMLTNIKEKEEAKEPTNTLDISRRSSATVDLAPGPHTINPFGIQFTIVPDGISSTDPRVRIDAKARRVEVICHPVRFRTLAGAHTVANPLDITCGPTTLLLGLNNVFAEIAAKKGSPDGGIPKAGSRSLTMYMPASGATSYSINNVTFDVDGSGTVKLAADARNARCANGRDIELLLPAQPPKPVPATQPIGVSFFGATKSVSIGNTPIAPDPSGAGSTYITVPQTGNRSISLSGMNTRLPATDPARPHIVVLWDVASAACWTVETAPLAARPGSEWSCRILPAAGKPPALPAAVNVTLESATGGPAGGEMSLKSAAGVFTGTLPAKPGLWKLRAAPDAGPLKGQALGVVAISESPTAAVSLFTVNNRALQRRGAPIELLWVARRNAGAAASEWPVRLRGVGLDAVVAKISVPAAGPDKTADVSGKLTLDSTALASGDYSIAVESDGVVAYPFRFRICQRERLSDFDVYSWHIHTKAAVPFPGSPVNSYVGEFDMNAPGVSPFLSDGDGALDGIFGAYANAPLGPLPERFVHPDSEERRYMALAAMGLHSAPTWPQAHPYETCNPKHTLPENLAWVRRRMALFAQTHADYPGIDGFDYGWNWQTSAKGYWGDSGPGRLDAWQPEAAKQSEEVAWKLTQKMWPDVVAKYANLKPVRTAPPEKWPKELADIPGLTESQLKYVNSFIAPNGWQMRLPNTFAEWYADLNEILPGMTHHAHVSSCGLGGGIQYWEWHGKTHRASIDMSERFMSPFDGWISPAVMAMDNQDKQKVQLAIQSHAMRSEDIPSLFAAAGRGVDGFAFTDFSDKSDQDFIGRGRVFERFGSWFVSFDPLPDVALYAAKDKNAVRTALYDLARIRRPGVMLGPRDVEAGELLKYKVLLLLGIGDELPPDILSAFRAFETKGGVILKDDACHKNVPGRSIGMAYQGKTLAGSWGGAQAGGEYEHEYVWKIFLEKQDTLVKAFADTPRPPIATPDTDVLISPLAGKDSIICFVINKTEIPLEVTFPLDEKSSRFRQGQVLPKVSELQVEKGWYVHNLLTGKAAPSESTAKGLRVPISLTGAEGEIYLLTRKKPENMVIQATRSSPAIVRLTGGLADGQGNTLSDPMPFEVTLKGPNGVTLFHKFASIGPEHPLELPVPAMSADARSELVIRDLVLGTTATQVLEPSSPSAVSARQTPDVIGGEKKVLDFLTQRKEKGPVTILLDEGQETYRPAAEKLAAVLKSAGRESRITTLDTTTIHPLPLRWYPQPEDLKVLNSVTNDRAWAWRVDMSISASQVKDKTGRQTGTDYTRPEAGYAEMGPRLRHDADVILFGTPSDHRAVADLAPWLRRVPTDNYPATGGFFIHYLWSPFRATYDAIYLGCRDAAGAEAAVAALAAMKPPEPVQAAKVTDKPLTIRASQPAPLENMQNSLGGTPVLNLEYSPSGNRLFAATFGYGEWLFALDTEGKVLQHLLPPETETWPNWYRWGRWATPLSDTLLRIHLWDGMYQYELGRGWISRATKSSMLEDKAAGLAFLAGTDKLRSLDPQGRILWQYDDVLLSPDLTLPREVIPKALSGDKRVLLVSAFARDRNNTIVSQSIIGLDSATGKVLWNRDGVLLSAGKVISLPDRFLVMSDDGTTQELLAQDGQRGNAMTALTGRPDWVLEAPDRKLLIAENSHINRQGLACRIYFRSLTGAPDLDISVQGRVSAMELAPDKRSFLVATTAGRLYRFSTDGALLWQMETPVCGRTHFSPDGNTIASAGMDGVVRLFNATDGKLRASTDLNAYNVITAEAYAKQPRMGQLPLEVSRTPQPLPPEPSYSKSLSKQITFGPNLVPADTLRPLLLPFDATVTDTNASYLGKLAAPVKLPAFKTTAGTTYLVELLTLSTTPTNPSPLLRIEIAVKGRMTSKNMPYTTRLPVGKELVRYRAAFRSDEDDEVSLTLRPVIPRTSGKTSTYENAATSDTPAIVGDFLVSAITFPGPNVMFDGGPGARSKPAGSFTCTAYPLEDGDSSTAKGPVDCTDAALRLVNGQIANQKTDWGKTRGGKYGPNQIPLTVKYAEAIASIQQPKTLKAIAVYEDNTGPVVGLDNKVQERAAMRYCVDVRNATGTWVRVGAVYDNRQLVNIFPCPPYKINGIRYIWAGEADDRKGHTDGYVRTAQIEAYTADKVATTIDELINKTETDLPPPSDGF